jgi:alpha-galactosidase
MTSTFLHRVAPIALTTLSFIAAMAQTSPEIRTPVASATPRINGPAIFGVTPGAPFLYTIPATGQRPMSFAVDALPDGLSVDAATGQITGKLAKTGEYKIVFKAKNALGAAEKTFHIMCGDKIALTPAMGWNSWNCWAGAVDQAKVLKSAQALAVSGLANHGWVYVNIDDTWQGRRDPKTLALQANERFPDMKKLCDEIHAMGLKPGIYSGPWITTYAGYPGGSSDDAKGAWEKLKDYESNKRFGKFSFAKQDAKQWAEWGFDYLKYDWDPNDVPHTKEMSQALRATGRDILFSLSNTAPIEHAAEFVKLSNSWRTTGDMWDTWETPGPWQNSVSEIGFNQDAWTPWGGPGHFCDPDMLVIGWVGWGDQLHYTKLTPAEQYSHITLWCLLGSPLLIGCDLDRLDSFTLNLLTNDEVIAVDQDVLGKQGKRVATIGAIDVYKKELEDGSLAFGFFNRGDVPHTIVAKMDRMGCNGPQQVRDLWRQKDLPEVRGDFSVTVGVHDAELFKFKAKK